jgi:hypothetical protein
MYKENTHAIFAASSGETKIACNQRLVRNGIACSIIFPTVRAAIRDSRSVEPYFILFKLTFSGFSPLNIYIIINLLNWF